MVHLWIVFRYSQLLKVMALLGALGISDNSPFGQYWGIIKMPLGEFRTRKKTQRPTSTLVQRKIPRGAIVHYPIPLSDTPTVQAAL